MSGCVRNVSLVLSTMYAHVDIDIDCVDLRKATCLGGDLPRASGQLPGLRAMDLSYQRPR